MNSECLRAGQEVSEAIENLETLDVGGSLRESQSPLDRVQQLIHSVLKKYPCDVQQRISSEFFEFGPLDLLFKSDEISEILVNGPTEIWLEINGQLQRHDDHFYSQLTFDNIIHRLCQRAGVFANQEVPFCEGSISDLAFGKIRLTLIRPEMTGGQSQLSLRKHPKQCWTLPKLKEIGWCNQEQEKWLQQLIFLKANFLVVGPTGAGKTSVLNSLLHLIPKNERAVIIEDTSEIQLSNLVSMKLQTREDPQKILPDILQSDLVKRSLRLRPDRIVMGEIRGSEAKDFLMSLATGHSGSFGSLHAQSAQQALIRLEMLIQMGAPQWNLVAIRRLIQLSLNFIVVIEKKENGQRAFNGLYRISSLEDHGFLLEEVDRDLKFV